MRVLIFHGYLLRGTGSNVYNALLAEALTRLGHEVHLVCQERHPEDLPFVGVAGDWDEGTLQLRTLREGVATTIYRPDIGPVLPTYVADRYEGIEARTFAQLDDDEVATYVQRNVAAVREVVERVQPEVALANHLVMGPLVLARALGDDVPYAVKIHGSALEYTVKPQLDRFLPAAREGLASARCVLVGSLHVARSLWETMEDRSLPGRTRLGPPGVDVELFAPLDPPAAAQAVQQLADRLAVAAAEPARDTESAFARDLADAARAVATLVPGRDRHVAFVGKLIVSKGVDLLAAAWPLVLAAVPDARLIVIGFGSYSEGFERLLEALTVADLGAVRTIAQAGRALEGGPPTPLKYLLAFLDELETADDRDAYLAAASRLPERVVRCGRLEHDELAPLLSLSEAQVVPSTFPEAFGMVASEGAACGLLPVCAAHSGLTEVTARLAEVAPEEVWPWLSFEVGPRAVRDLAGCLIAWLTAEPQLRAATREAFVTLAQERFSWEGAARAVVDAGLGQLDALPEP